MFNVRYVVATHDKTIYDKYISIHLKNKDPILVDDSPKLNGMCQKYNKGIKLLGEIESNDIIVFVHEDVKIIDDNFERKLQMYFSGNKDLGVLGVYGTSHYAGGGWWNYERPYYSFGKIRQCFNDGSVKTMSDNFNVSFRKDMLIVDGCMMAIRGDLLKKQKFDESIKGYHHYDNSYCLDTIINTDYKVAVGDLDILHLSEGDVNKEWESQAKILLNKYINKGFNNMPLTCEKLKRK